MNVPALAAFLALFLLFGCLDEMNKSYQQADSEFAKMIGLDAYAGNNSASGAPAALQPVNPGSTKPNDSVATPLPQVKEATAGYAWTEWYNRDNPGGKGDYETLSSIADACSQPIGIECRAVDSDVDYLQTGDVYHCDVKLGGYCMNSENPNGCHDYKVRFLCPKNP